MTETNVLIGLVSVLFSALIGILTWLGNSMVSKLDKIATSVNNIEKDLGVLANDHTNLKNDHDELKSRVDRLYSLYSKN